MADEEKKEAPESTDKGKPEERGEAPLDVPDKLKGKSPQEIAKMYVGLEKKLGEQSGEVGKTRELQEKMELVLQAIWADPELYRQVERGIQSVMSGESLRPQKRETEGGEEAKKSKEKAKSEVKPDDTRLALENQIISEFQKKYGFDALPSKERQVEYAKVATALAELLDPGGTKSIREVLSSISLQKLPKFLDNAYWIANREKLLEKGRLQGLLSEDERRQASIGGLPSSSGKSEEGVELTAKERKVAAKMGISADKYAQTKAKIIKESKLE